MSPLAQAIEQAVQFRPVPSPARRGFLEHAFATGGPERLRLQGVVLFVPSGARVERQQELIDAMKLVEVREGSLYCQRL